MAKPDVRKAQTIDVAIEPAQVSDRRCPAGLSANVAARWRGHLLGEEAFWCETCNAYANELAQAERKGGA